MLAVALQSLKNQRIGIKYFILTNPKDKDLQPRYLLAPPPPPPTTTTTTTTTPMMPTIAPFAMTTVTRRIFEANFSFHFMSLLNQNCKTCQKVLCSNWFLSP